MIYKSKRSETKQKVLIHLFITHQALHQEMNSASELFFFLIKYSFLFTTNDITQKICILKTTHFLDPQGNGENGARYLDPKYSRWISVDPALGEYVPSAGKYNEADKLPGMGGIFNSVNLSLYHYAGNNPIKYTDTDGRADVWIAFETVLSGGTDSRFYNGGTTALYGKAHVTFLNLTTFKSFSQTYDILCFNSLGINAYAGFAAGVTIYSKIFDDNTSEKDIIDSYTGIFASVTNPVSAILSVADAAGFSVSVTFVVGLNPKYEYGIDLTQEIPWIGANVSLSWNLFDLIFPGGIGVPAIGIQYQVYKLPGQNWSDYQAEFDASARYSQSFSSAFPYA